VSKSAPLTNVSRASDGALLSAETAPPVRASGAACGDAAHGGPMAGWRGGGDAPCPGGDCCLRATRSLQPGEEWFGGGVQLYSGPAQRGNSLFLKTNAIVGKYPGWSHVVAPLFFSSRGYGVLLNSHAYSFFDLGQSSPGHEPLPPATACDVKWADKASGHAVGPLNLTCPGGADWVISNITFAHYGLSGGDCSRGLAPSHHCDAADQRANVSALCLGRHSCSVPVSNAFAGADPCVGNNQKHLSVSATCSGGAGPVPAPKPGVPGAAFIATPDPVVDMVFLAGPTMHDALGQYTALTGRMSMPPKWSLGLWYHPDEKTNQSGVLDLVSDWEAAEVKLSALTLEPPWQTHAYSCTYVWNAAHFWDVPAFLANLTSHGVRLTLWEHGYVHNETASPLFRPLLEQGCAADWETWDGLTPDFTLNSTRALFAAYHNETFVSAGVAGFKLDECDGNPGDYDPGSNSTKRWFFPDTAAFPSGLSGAQMHNIFGLHYARTFHDMYAAAGLRTFLKARANYVGGQAHPTTFYSDSYDLPNYLLGVVNSGFGGWVFAPEVRKSDGDSDFARRAQLMLFSALASMDAWNTGFVPWGDDVSAANAAMFVRLAAERESLQTFLYSAYYRQSTTGVPVARALVVDHEADNATWTLAEQFLLGDGLLVAPAAVNSTSIDVYFPAGGNWTDYWRADPTVHVGGTSANLPTTDATIPLFQRVGAAIPLVVAGDGSRRALTLRLDAAGRDCAAGSRRSSTVYDDDGVTTRSARFVMEVTSTCGGGGKGAPPSWGARVLEGGWVPAWQQAVFFELHGRAAASWASVTCDGQPVEHLGSDAGVLRALPPGGFGWVRDAAGVVTVATPLVPSAGSSVRCFAEDDEG
jgi:alpha-glucosidase (family GH31 glycosyl hydrolase)